MRICGFHGLGCRRGRTVPCRVGWLAWLAMGLFCWFVSYTVRGLRVFVLVNGRFCKDRQSSRLGKGEKSYTECTEVLHRGHRGKEFGKNTECRRRRVDGVHRVAEVTREVAANKRSERIGTFIRSRSE